MGAKQSKRSVDISGKEAEGAGEVAAAGAGGEGRVEQLADADSLKPQLNGDAHIHEASDKEKQLDSGTPENEKDATTEKEGKEGDEGKEKETPAITNGESEQKEENGEAVATSEDAKKPKKEKVKKKWSLRSISFSRKEKPKQEKKAKEDDAKTPNGDQEKLAEEVAESTPENAINEVAEEAKSDTETKDDKTPETPVTEPITNGSNTPESPKTEPSPTTDEPLPESPKEHNRPEPKAALPEPEQLPVNGLSLEEPKVEAPEVVKCEESTIEKTSTETSVSVPAPEIPVTKEVCVEQMPMIEPSPPPLPANPPPSSVVSFAATTMAPELTDASLATTADITSTAAPIATIDTNTDIVDKDPTETNHIENDTVNAITDIPSKIKETVEEITAPALPTDPIQEPVDIPTSATDKEVNGSVDEADVVSNTNKEETTAPEPPLVVTAADNLGIPEIVINESQPTPELPSPKVIDAEPKKYDDDTFAAGDKETTTTDKKEPATGDITINGELNEIEESMKHAKISDEHEAQNECNGKMEEEASGTEEVPLPVDIVGDAIAVEATTPDDSTPPSLSEAMGSQGDQVSNDASESFPLPPSELCRSVGGSRPETPPLAVAPQDVLPVADKIADLIPEVPVVPELKTDMETANDVAVAN
ncbi:unnamed protein product, partial [Iphiclides podalirius]